MRRPLHILIAALAAIAVTVTAGEAGAACLKPSEPGLAVEGTVGLVKRRHPNGTLVSGYVLKLRAPVCLDDPEALDDVRRVTRVHVAAAGPLHEALLKRSLGKTVRVTGEAMSAHTHYHLAPIVLLNATITTR